MPKVSIFFGLILILIGLVGYFGALAGLFSTGASPTALIPAALGLIVVICGVIGLKSEKARKHAMHVVAVIALLGILGTVTGLLKLPALFAGDAERPVAIIAQSLTAITSLVLFGFCFQSFLKARVLK